MTELRERGPWLRGDRDPGWPMLMVGEHSGTVYRREADGGSPFGARWFDETASPVEWTVWDTLLAQEREVRAAGAFFEPVPDAPAPGTLRCATCHDPWPLGMVHLCVPPVRPTLFRLGHKNERNLYLQVDQCEWHVGNTFSRGLCGVLVEAANEWLAAVDASFPLPVCKPHNRCVVHEMKGDTDRDFW